MVAGTTAANLPASGMRNRSRADECATCWQQDSHHAKRMLIGGKGMPYVYNMNLRCPACCCSAAPGLPGCGCLQVRIHGTAVTARVRSRTYCCPANTCHFPAPAAADDAAWTLFITSICCLSADFRSLNSVRSSSTSLDSACRKSAISCKQSQFFRDSQKLTPPKTSSATTATSPWCMHGLWMRCPADGSKVCQIFMQSQCACGIVEAQLQGNSHAISVHCCCHEGWQTVSCTNATVSV